MSEQTNEALPADKPEALAAVEAAGEESEPAGGSGGTTGTARRRRRRGGRGRGRPGATLEGDGSAPEPADTADADVAQPSAPRRLGSVDATAGEAEGTAAPARRPGTRTRRRRSPGEKAGGAQRRPRPQTEPEAASTEPDAADDGLSGVATGEAAPATARRRRRRRGGRGRARPARPGVVGEGASVSGEEDDEETRGPTLAVAADIDMVTEEPPTPAEPVRIRRRAPKPKGEAAEKDPVAGGPKTVAARRRGAAPEPPTEPEAAPVRRSRRRSTSSSGSTSGSRSATATAEAPVVVEEAEGPEASQPTRTRRGRVPGRRRRERDVPVQRVRDKTMLITEIGERDQIAVLEGRDLVEHYITRAGSRSMVGNIYVGKVQNVLPGMEAAFVDVGRGRNAVLYAGEVSYDEEIDGEAHRIEKVLKSGQNVLVQVTKDPLGGKGARLTQEISLPGRFLVFVPNSQVFGISRRLPDGERQRLKTILKEIKPPEHGLIVRTAAEGASAEDIRTDLERLTVEWADIAKAAKSRAKAPRVLYEEPELTVRVIRDLFTEGEFKEIVTDSIPVYDQVVTYLRNVAPDLLPRVRMHEGPLPLLEAFHVVEQIHKALDRKVWLKSGGYLVIDKTEALTVIDVNTGKHVGKGNLEETVTKTNLEAAEEVARQLRLRDIGGIIVIDFIDMMLEKNKDKVIQTMKNAMAQDKTRSQVFDIGPLGILEVTRKRVSAGLLESFSETCPTCEGRGIILTHKI